MKVGRGPETISEINVTPFVDVMLVLLIIFMVTAPLIQAGVDVNLPETTAKGLRSPEDPTIIVITKEGEMRGGARVITATQELLDELLALQR